MDKFKIKILRCLVTDWQMLYGYATRSESQDQIESKRSFVKNNYESLVRQRKQCNSWEKFYLTYKYS